MNDFEQLSAMSAKVISNKNSKDYYVMNKDVPLIRFNYENNIAILKMV